MSLFLFARTTLFVCRKSTGVLTLFNIRDISVYTAGRRSCIMNFDSTSFCIIIEFSKKWRGTFCEAECNATRVYGERERKRERVFSSIFARPHPLDDFLFFLSFRERVCRCVSLPGDAIFCVVEMTLGITPSRKFQVLLQNARYKLFIRKSLV